jgi:hypothetical protein
MGVLLTSIYASEARFAYTVPGCGLTIELRAIRVSDRRAQSHSEKGLRDGSEAYGGMGRIRSVRIRLPRLCASSLLRRRLFFASQERFGLTPEESNLLEIPEGC